MGMAILGHFKTEEDAKEYVEKHNIKNLHIYYEPDLNAEKPYTVNME
jgi:hypothetical protein